MPSEPYALAGTEGERIAMLGTEIRVLAGTRTGAPFSIMAVDLPPGEGPPPHIHDDEDEAFIVLRGQMRFLGGDKEWVLGAGGFVYLPRGIIHRPSVEGNEAASVLAILSRPGLEDFFADFAAALGRSGGPPSLELLDKVGAGYGLRHFAPGA